MPLPQSRKLRYYEGCGTHQRATSIYNSVDEQQQCKRFNCTVIWQSARRLHGFAACARETGHLHSLYNTIILSDIQHQRGVQSLPLSYRPAFDETPRESPSPSSGVVWCVIYVLLLHYPPGRQGCWQYAT